MQGHGWGFLNFPGHVPSISDVTNTAAAPASWQNRIIGHGEEPPDQLLANPQNWRVHPKTQQDALSAVLDTVGWVQQIVVNQRTGHVVDGHLRVSLAISRQEPSVPVIYVDLSPEEEALVLATLDPLAAMAATDREMLADLLAGIERQDDGIAQLLATLAEEQGITPPDFAPVGIEEQSRLDEKSRVRCPECGHEFTP